MEIQQKHNFEEIRLFFNSLPIENQRQIFDSLSRETRRAFKFLLDCYSIISPRNKKCILLNIVLKLIDVEFVQKNYLYFTLKKIDPERTHWKHVLKKDIKSSDDTYYLCKQSNHQIEFKIPMSEESIFFDKTKKQKAKLIFITPILASKIMIGHHRSTKSSKELDRLMQNLNSKKEEMSSRETTTTTTTNSYEVVHKEKTPSSNEEKLFEIEYATRMFELEMKKKCFELDFAKQCHELIQKSEQIQDETLSKFLQDKYKNLLSFK